MPNEVAGKELKLEKEKLKKLLDDVKTLLREWRYRCPYPEITEYSVADSYDEVADLNYKKRSNKNFYDMKVLPWTDAVNNPYFGRLDYTCNNVKETAYIGEKDLWDLNGNNVVISGYSEVGKFYLQTMLKNTESGRNKYKALLRRKFQISFGEIEFAEDTYSSEKTCETENVTDPYLQRVLAENRNYTEMRSILSSIQDKQFDIIFQPIDSSFIVQGCAGSGKTAILFQRLANFQYNIPDYINEEVKLITPNEGFTSFVGPLAKQLGLDKIKVLTISQYYDELLERYGIEYPQTSHIFDDSDLNDRFVAEIYSDSFYMKIARESKQWISKFLDSVDFKTLQKRTKIVYDKEKNHSNLDNFLNYIYRSLDLMLLDNADKDNKGKYKFIEKEEQIIKTNETLKKIIKPRDSFNSIFYKNADIQEVLFTFSNQIIELIKEYNDIIERNSLDKSYLIKTDGNMNLFALEQALSTMHAFEQGYTTMLNQHFNKIEKAQERYKDLSSSEEYKNLMFDRSSLIEEKEEMLKDIDDLEFLSPLRKITLENEIGRIDQQIQEIDENALVKEFKSLKEIVDNKENYHPNLKKDIIEKVNIIKSHISGKSSDFCNLVFANDNYNLCFDYYLIKELEKLVEGGKSNLLRRIYNEAVIPLIKEKAKNYNYRISGVSDLIDLKRHTFTLYLRLVIVDMFCTKLPKSDKLICIDEAQEHSKNEIILLYDLNITSYDRKPLLNIYGDINQRSSVKGIRDWNIFMPFPCSKMYTLTENYRNSKEVVDFTNSELKLSDLAIGLEEGNKVEFLSKNESLNFISENNVCVIANRNSRVYKVLESIILKDNNIYSKRDYKLLLTPVEAKGQEFPTVIVFDKEMSNTDKYVSYTRAKSKLLICRDY